MSSLLISPYVNFSSESLLEKISNIVALSPRNCICVVRTTAPDYFRGNMKIMQKKSIDYLRDKCYVVVFSPKREFLNHAKFLLCYHKCFSENIVYRGKYFGSTNLTRSGLWRPRQNLGNYEEFTFSKRVYPSISKTDKFYLNEILDLITHKSKLYTDTQYLRTYVSSHLIILKNLLEEVDNITSRGRDLELESLYEVYINCLLTHIQTFALLDEIPGKELTQKIVEELTSKNPPPNPFEIEMILTDPKYANLLMEDLDLDRNSLYELTKEHADSIKTSSDLIGSRYLNKIGEIENYIDEQEKNFVKFLREYNEIHFKNLKDMMNKI